jgi:hypothetical protein
MYKNQRIIGREIRGMRECVNFSDGLPCLRAARGVRIVRPERGAVRLVIDKPIGAVMRKCRRNDINYL